MVPALNVANYLILKSQVKDIGHDMSNLKLQKLLYYCQGFHLAITGEVLFPEEITRWTHGPVVADIYDVMKGHGPNPLPTPEVDPDELVQAIGSEKLAIIDDVYSVYDQFSAWQLRNLSHSEPPWQNTPPNEVISTGQMASFFATRLQSA